MVEPISADELVGRWIIDTTTPDYVYGCSGYENSPAIRPCEHSFEFLADGTGVVAHLWDPSMSGQVNDRVFSWSVSDRGTVVIDLIGYGQGTIELIPNRRFADGSTTMMVRTKDRVGTVVTHGQAIKRELGDAVDIDLGSAVAGTTFLQGYYTTDPRAARREDGEIIDAWGYIYGESGEFTYFNTLRLRSFEGASFATGLWGADQQAYNLQAENCWYGVRQPEAAHEYPLDCPSWPFNLRDDFGIPLPEDVYDGAVYQTNQEVISVSDLKGDGHVDRMYVMRRGIVTLGDCELDDYYEAYLGTRLGDLFGIDLPCIDGKLTWFRSLDLRMLDATKTFEWTDADLDGVLNHEDFAPLDPTEAADSDGDGVGDNADAFPDDATESLDTDGDGIGNNADTDDDGDGVDDVVDAFPLDSTESVDTDGDGIGNNRDSDDDGDGVDDSLDAFPLDPSEAYDTDSDGIGNRADDDDDDDGVPDSRDAFPLDPTESVDTDGDGVGNERDDDDDGDGIPDADDQSPLGDGFVDGDGDGLLNNEDADANGDGVPDAFADFISGGKSSTTIVFRRSSYEASNISFATGWGLNGVTLREDGSYVTGQAYGRKQFGNWTWEPEGKTLTLQSETPDIAENRILEEANVSNIDWDAYVAAGKPPVTLAVYDSVRLMLDDYELTGSKWVVQAKFASESFVIGVGETDSIVGSWKIPAELGAVGAGGAPFDTSTGRPMQTRLKSDRATSMMSTCLVRMDPSLTSSRTPPGSRSGRAAATRAMFQLRHTTALRPQLTLTAAALSR